MPVMRQHKLVSGYVLQLKMAAEALVPGIMFLYSEGLSSTISHYYSPHSSHILIFYFRFVEWLN
jgi:hypothetical protein